MKKINEEGNQKLTMQQFASWIGLDPKAISLAKTIVDMSDPDGAYTHLQDMGEEDAAEAVEVIWFEYGSLKAAIQACKEDMNLSESNKLNELKKIIRKIVKEEIEK